MRNIIFIVLLFICGTVYGAQKALTDTGDEVILNDDGTWEYLDPTIMADQKISTNKQKFSKPSEASFLLKSKRSNSAFWIDNDKWKIGKADGDEDDVAEYEFKLRGEPVHALSISEGFSIPLKSLAGVALENARAGTPNLKVVEKEYRNVNGIKVIFMKFTGTLRGIKVTYFGYYHSDDFGSTQYVAYTGTDVASRYRNEIIKFLNGLTIQ